MKTLPGAPTDELDRLPVAFAEIELPLMLVDPLEVEPLPLKLTPDTSADMLPELDCELTSAMGAIAPVPAAASRRVAIDELPVASAMAMLPLTEADPFSAPAEAPIV